MLQSIKQTVKIELFKDLYVIQHTFHQLSPCIFA